MTAPPINRFSQTNLNVKKKIINSGVLLIIFYLILNSNNALLLGEADRDVIVMRHEIGIIWPGGNRENRGITLVEYGDVKGHTAMSRMVGLPAAIAAKMVLDGIYVLHFLNILHYIYILNVFNYILYTRIIYS